MVRDMTPASHQVVLLLESLHDRVHVAVFPSLHWELRHLQQRRTETLKRTLQ